ncbi:MAG TPA: hypothetical protein VF473_11420 [Cyclobacteriaceae bacterium]
MGRRGGFMSPKGYYVRAKVFGYLMVVVAVALLFYYLFTTLS